jgi:hypothetical protein
MSDTLIGQKPGKEHSMNRKTALYCRSALYNEIAVARQEAQCREYAHTLGFADANIAIYRDCGASGATLDRPAMNALTADIKIGNVDTVITRDSARVARNITLVSEWLELLRAYGVNLVTLAGDTDGEIGNRLTYSLVGDYYLSNSGKFTLPFTTEKVIVIFASIVFQDFVENEKVIRIFERVERFHSAPPCQ